VHISDISWTGSLKHPSEIYGKGDTVQAVVLDMDRENQRISLGIKQLAPDPWKEVPERYKPGSPVTGKVVNVTAFGLFVELQDGVEGLLHVSEIPKGSRKNLSDYQPGDLVEAIVVRVSEAERKIELSVRKTEEDSRHQEEGIREVVTNLGDLIREEMRDGGQRQ
jgi:small subunit ribosomal protein S1